MRTAEDVFRSQFVATVFADRFLRKRFVDQDVGGHFCAVRTNRRAENKMAAAALEGAGVALGLGGVETDHVDHYVEGLILSSAFEGVKVVAIHGDLRARRER